MRRRATALRCCCESDRSRVRRRLGSSPPPMWNASIAAAAARALAVPCSGTCCARFKTPKSAEAYQRDVGTLHSQTQVRQDAHVTVASSSAVFCFNMPRASLRLFHRLESRHHEDAVRQWERSAAQVRMPLVKRMRYQCSQILPSKRMC